MGDNLPPRLHEDPQSLVESPNATMNPIMYIYPATEEPTLRRLLITMYLIACLTIGICGNFSQLTLQYYAYRLRTSNTSGMKTYAQMYICMLHIVYFSISISLPSVIIEQLIQIWMFGILTCVTHLFLVTVGRTAAAWLTVMLFLDQLLTNFKTKKGYLQSRRNYYVSLAFITVVCMFSSLPTIIYINLTQEIMHEQNVSGQSMTTTVKVRTYKCSSTPPDTISIISRSISFLTDCLFPLIAIIVCLVLTHFKSQVRGTLAKYSLRKQHNLQLVIALLYFIGNSLQWFAIGSIHFGGLSDDQSETLADLATLLQYTLPAVVWVPLSILSSSLSISCNDSTRIIRRCPGPETTVSVPHSHRWSAGELSLFPLFRHSQTTGTPISMSHSLLSNAESEAHNFRSVPRRISSKNTNIPE